MSEQKKPATGEFWRHMPSNQISHVCGFGFDGHVICEANYDGVVVLEEDTMESFLLNFEYLPWCTSFDNPEPVAETWPKYHRAEGGQAFVRRDSRVRAVYVHRDGVETDFGEWESCDDSRDQFTESEALARLQVPVQPCPDCNAPLTPGHADVCPEAWVEITDPEHVLRSRIDHLELSNSCGWISVEGMTGETVDRSKRVFGFGSVRTRRKNLPPLPVPQPSTPDPGDGWRLIDKAVDVPQEGDQVNCCIDIEHQCWANHPQTEPFDMSPVSHYRRRITPATNSPFGDAMSEPETVPIQFMVPRRILDGGDWPVRACLAGEQISDSATWLPVTIDRLGNTSVRKAVQE